MKNISNTKQNKLTNKTFIIKKPYFPWEKQEYTISTEQTTF